MTLIHLLIVLRANDDKKNTSNIHIYDIKFSIFSTKLSIDIFLKTIYSGNVYNLVKFGPNIKNVKKIGAITNINENKYDLVKLHLFSFLFIDSIKKLGIELSTPNCTPPSKVLLILFLNIGNIYSIFI